MSLASSKRAGLVVDTLAPLGDYLREHQLVSGYGFEQTPEGVVCRFQNCRFADTAHKLTEESMPCVPCPVFQLMQAALQKRYPSPSLRDHAILDEDGVMCVFHLNLLHEE
jgi:hypothetical protein